MIRTAGRLADAEPYYSPIWPTTSRSSATASRRVFVAGPSFVRRGSSSPWTAARHVDPGRAAKTRACRVEWRRRGGGVWGGRPARRTLRLARRCLRPDTGLLANRIWVYVGEAASGARTGYRDRGGRSRDRQPGRYVAWLATDRSTSRPPVAFDFLAVAADSSRYDTPDAASPSSAGGPRRPAACAGVSPPSSSAYRPTT